MSSAYNEIIIQHLLDENILNLNGNIEEQLELIVGLCKFVIDTKGIDDLVIDDETLEKYLEMKRINDNQLCTVM